MKISFPRRKTFFVLSSLFYLIFVWLSIVEPSLDYIIIILGGKVMGDYHVYNEEKQKLSDKGLSGAELEEAIKALADKLGI